MVDYLIGGRKPGITTNIDKVMKDVEKQQKKIDKAVVRALNRAGRDTHPEAKRQLRSKYTIPARLINKAKQPPQKASASRYRYLLEYESFRVNVKDYRLRQNTTGITWMVQKGKRNNLPHGFKVGHNSPDPARRIDKFGMIRTGRFKTTHSTRGTIIRREIIKSVTGPSVPQLLSTKGIDRRLQKFFRKKYNTLINKYLR